MIRLLDVRPEFLKDKPAFDNFVNENAFAFEKIYHGNPSGIDNTTATFGGIILYNKSKEVKF